MMATMRWPRRFSSETRRMPRWGALSLVLGLALLLSGCAGLIGGKASVPTADAPRPEPRGRGHVPGGGGVRVQKGRRGFFGGAPHGPTDSAPAVMGLEPARRTGFGAA